MCLNQGRPFNGTVEFSRRFLFKVVDGKIVEEPNLTVEERLLLEEDAGKIDEYNANVLSYLLEERNESPRTNHYSDPAQMALWLKEGVSTEKLKEILNREKVNETILEEGKQMLADAHAYATTIKDHSIRMGAPPRIDVSKITKENFEKGYIGPVTIVYSPIEQPMIDSGTIGVFGEIQSMTLNVDNGTETTPIDIKDKIYRNTEGHTLITEDMLRGYPRPNVEFYISIDKTEVETGNIQVNLNSGYRNGEFEIWQTDDIRNYGNMDEDDTKNICQSILKGKTFTDYPYINEPYNFEKKTIKLNIRKEDSDTGKPLEGATFDVLISNIEPDGSKTIEGIVTDERGIYDKLEEIIPKDETKPVVILFTETVSPKGYETNAGDIFKVEFKRENGKWVGTPENCEYDQDTGIITIKNESNLTGFKYDYHEQENTVSEAEMKGTGEGAVAKVTPKNKGLVHIEWVQTNVLDKYNKLRTPAPQCQLKRLDTWGHDVAYRSILGKMGNTGRNRSYKRNRSTSRI